MSPMAMDQLERELRAARTAFDDVPVSPDAWQRNQDLLASGVTDDRRRTFTAVAAGVVVLLVIAAGWLALGGRNDASDVPGSGGSGSSDSSSGDLADPVQVARIDLPDGSVTLEVGIEPHKEKADEPSLCYQLSAGSSDGDSASGTGGCTSKVDRAELPGVTVDYLTGSNDEMWTTLTGAVDRRTAALTMWQADGTAIDVDLHELSGGKLRAFGFLTNGPTSTRPVRLVAWADDAKQEVLQSVDVVRAFDPSWLPGERANCASVQEKPHLRLPSGSLRYARVRASFTDVWIVAEMSGATDDTACLAMERQLEAVRLSDDIVVVVVAPEVAEVSTEGGTPRTVTTESIGMTMWRAGVLEMPGDTDEIVATDESGQVLQSVPVPHLR